MPPVATILASGLNSQYVSGRMSPICVPTVPNVCNHVLNSATHDVTCKTYLKLLVQHLPVDFAVVRLGQCDAGCLEPIASSAAIP